MEAMVWQVKHLGLQFQSWCLTGTTAGTTAQQVTLCPFVVYSSQLQG